MFIDSIRLPSFFYTWPPVSSEGVHLWSLAAGPGALGVLIHPGVLFVVQEGEEQRAAAEAVVRSPLALDSDRPECA